MVAFVVLVREMAAIQEYFEQKNAREASRVFYTINLLEEAGELAEVIKSEDFYGVKPEENLEEEVADIFYSLVGICRHSGIDFERAILKRIGSMRKKYGIPDPQVAQQ